MILSCFLRLFVYLLHIQNHRAKLRTRITITTRFFLLCMCLEGVVPEEVVGSLEAGVISNAGSQVQVL